MENISVNVANSQMKNPPLQVGVIIPPDDHYRPVLYSDAKSTYEFGKINRDIYQGIKSSKNLNEKKTPTLIKFIIGIAALLCSIPLIKKLFR